MFDIAWSEFLVVAVVALVVVGPKDLPALLRTVGKTIASLRRMAGEFQSQFNDAMREAELDDFKKEMYGLKDQASRLTGSNPFQIARDELKNALDSRPAPSALAGVAPGPDAFHDAPSALAPNPEIAPVEEPPPPAAGEFASVAPPEPKPDDKPTKAQTKPRAEGPPKTRPASKAAAVKAPEEPRAAKAEPPMAEAPQTKPPARKAPTPGASA